MAATCVCIPILSPSCLLPFWEDLEDQQVSLSQGPGVCEILCASALGPGVYEILRASVMSEISISHSPLALLKVNPTGLQSQTLWGLVFLVQDP